MKSPNIQEDKQMLVSNIITSFNGKDVSATPLDCDFLHRRAISIIGEITDELSALICASIRELSNRSTEPVKLYINSPGGSVSAAFAVYDEIKSHPDITFSTVADGMAASAAAFLVICAGTEGHRYCSANAELLLHQPVTAIQGQATDIEIAASHIQKSKKRLYNILADATGQSFEKIYHDCERDYILDADEALLYGAVDHIGRP